MFGLCYSVIIYGTNHNLNPNYISDTMLCHQVMVEVEQSVIGMEKNKEHAELIFNGALNHTDHTTNNRTNALQGESNASNAKGIITLQSSAEQLKSVGSRRGQ